MTETALSPQGLVPPPSPTHRRTPIRLSAVPNLDDTVAESSDSSIVIRMTPRQAGEEFLMVEVAHGDAEEEGEEKKKEEEKEEEKKEEWLTLNIHSGSQNAPAQPQCILTSVYQSFSTGGLSTL